MTHFFIHIIFENPISKVPLLRNKNVLLPVKIMLFGIKIMLFAIKVLLRDIFAYIQMILNAS